MQANPADAATLTAGDSSSRSRGRSPQELFEKPLGRIPGLPRFMIEETLELAAGVCFAVALHAHWRARQTEENASTAAGKHCAPAT
jgi:hypothetical protein